MLAGGSMAHARGASSAGVGTAEVRPRTETKRRTLCLNETGMMMVVWYEPTHTDKAAERLDFVRVNERISLDEGGRSDGGLGGTQ